MLRHEGHPSDLLREACGQRPPVGPASLASLIPRVGRAGPASPQDPRPAGLSAAGRVRGEPRGTKGTLYATPGPTRRCTPRQQAPPDPQAVPVDHRRGRSRVPGPRYRIRARAARPLALHRIVGGYWITGCRPASIGKHRVTPVRRQAGPHLPWPSPRAAARPAAAAARVGAGPGPAGSFFWRVVKPCSPLFASSRGWRLPAVRPRTC